MSGHDPTFLSMLLRIVVMLIGITLTIAGVAVWWIWIAKSVALRKKTRDITTALQALGQAGTVAESAQRLCGHAGAVPKFVLSAYVEMQLSAALPSDGLKERIVWGLERVEAEEAQEASRGIGWILAIAVVAPLLALWVVLGDSLGNWPFSSSPLRDGHMALLLGMFAAIPATIAYIGLTRSVLRYQKKVTDASAAVMQTVSRDLDRRLVGIEAVQYALGDADVLSSEHSV
jgi:biopolymer transport protein ExbB